MVAADMNSLSADNSGSWVQKQQGRGIVLQPLAIGQPEERHPRLFIYGVLASLQLRRQAMRKQKDSNDSNPLSNCRSPFLDGFKCGVV